MQGDTDQFQRELCDGSVSVPQLLSELLHLLQERLHLNTHVTVVKRDSGKWRITLIVAVAV